MGKAVVIDEVRVTVRVPAAAPDRAVRAAVRALAGPGVSDRLRLAVRRVLVPLGLPAGFRVSVGR